MGDPYAGIAKPVGEDPYAKVARRVEYEGGKAGVGQSAVPNTPQDDRRRARAAGARNAVGDTFQAVVDATKNGMIGQPFGGVPGLGRFFMPYSAQVAINEAEKIERETGITASDAVKQRLPGQDYKPTTLGGKANQAAVEFAPNLLQGPGGVGRRIARDGLGGLARLGLSRIAQVAAPAAGSVGGEVLAEKAGWGEAGQQGAKLAGALLGGGAVSAVQGGAPQSSRKLAEAVEGATPQQLAEAQRLGETGRRIGVPLTMAEGVQSTAPASRINQLARHVETAPEGAPIRQRMADRPAAVRAAGANALDAVAPARDPVRVQLDAQDEATGALRALERERSAAVDPMYKAAGKQDVDAQAVADLVADIRVRAAEDKTGLIGPRLTELADRLAPNDYPLTDVESLDRIRKYYRDASDLPPGSQGALNKEEAGAVNGFLQRFSNERGDGLLDAIPEFTQGRTTYAQISADTVDPALAGPLGDISAKNPNAARDVPALQRQTSALFPDQPPEGQAAVTGQALDALPNTRGDLTRQYLARQLAEGTQDTQAGQNQWGGARFATTVAGNPEQAATLAAALQRTGGAQEVGDLLDVLGATGTRLRPGSETAEKLAMDADLKKGVEAARVGMLGAQPWNWAERAFDAAGLNIAQRNRQRMADALMSEPERWPGLINDAQGETAARSLGARFARSTLWNTLLAGGAAGGNE